MIPEEPPPDSAKELFVSLTGVDWDSVTGLVGYYVLEGKKTRRVSLRQWAEWFENGDKRRVKREERGGVAGPVAVSTVFLGIDHGFSFFSDRPVLFETMIFGGPDDGYQTRCCTYDEALKMHRKACRRAFGPALKVVKKNG